MTLSKRQSMYLYLTIAIIAEVIATSALKSSIGFTKLLPSITVVIGYGFSFYFFALVIKTMPVGIAYALWAGLGIVLVTLIAAIKFQQIPDWPAIIGMACIITGVVIINMYSQTLSDH
ncbi:MAG: multidrug efflux SMR transporter [Gammaproteobacteria bacterium]|nr:multidrug efflux SMR transporter [Gammaproteobacteria bacterium]